MSRLATPRDEVVGSKRPSGACGNGTGSSARPVRANGHAEERDAAAVLRGAEQRIGGVWIELIAVSTMQTPAVTAAVEPRNEIVYRLSDGNHGPQPPRSLRPRSSTSSPPCAPAVTWRATGSWGSSASVSACCTDGAMGLEFASTKRAMR